MTDEKTSTRVPIAGSHLQKDDFHSLFQQGPLALALPTCYKTSIPNPTVSLQHDLEDGKS